MPELAEIYNTPIPQVLFLCTGNSCRSNMAEAWANHLHGDMLTAYSAGTEPKGLDQRAVAVMAEVGLDISGHTSKSLADVMHIPFDYVATVCSHAHETCPIFPGHARVIHKGFDDPPQLAARATTPNEAFTHYRRVRDEIQAFIADLPQTFSELSSAH